MQQKIGKRKEGKRGREGGSTTNHLGLIVLLFGGSDVFGRNTTLGKINVT
jgi:hypothetical protein